MSDSQPPDVDVVDEVDLDAIERDLDEVERTLDELARADEPAADAPPTDPA